ncbi:MAG: TIGR01777 family oxidoreductase [Acidimicrobiales bacterium]
MRVGVTGSSGLIGRSLVEALRERGDTVITFLRTTSAPSLGADVVRWDPERSHVDDADLKRASGFDAVVHLAGAGIGDHRWSTARKAEILASRIQSTSLLVRALGDVANGVKILASASAIGWYGSRGDAQLDETSSRGSGFLSDVCQSWEETASTLKDRATVALLRTGLVMSSRGGILKTQLPLFRLGLGGRYAAGSQWMSPISLSDEVRAILFVIDHEIAGPVNLTAPHALTNRAFTQQLARDLHRPAVFTVPRLALRAVLGEEMANELVLASQRVAPGVLQDAGFTFDHPDAASTIHWALRGCRAGKKEVK